MRVNSLAFRLFVTSAAWTLLVLPVAGFIIYNLYKEDVQTSFDGQLKKLVTALSVDSMAPAASEPVAPTNRYEPLFEVTQSGWYWQIKPVDGVAGKTLVSASLATAKLPSPYELKYPPDTSGMRWRNDVGPAGEPIRIVELIDAPGYDSDPSAPRYSIAVAGPLDWLEALVAHFRNRLVTALSLAGIGLVTVTLFQVRFGLLPLRKIGQGLAAVRSGDAARLEGELPAEVLPLQDELNALIQSNQDIVDRARTQVGNLAHALKTPLAVIVNESREDKSPFGAKVAEQAELMRDQVNLYLDRARLAARAGGAGRVTPVLPALQPIVRALERINRDKPVKITVDCSDSLRFQGEKQDLEEMLGNLVDNACKWARSKVHVRVEPHGATGRGAHRMLLVSVDDDGPGLSEAQRRQIGKRGLRLDETKPGSGLGLSIVIDLAQSYRGSFALEASALGGLGARLQLPSA
jgi:signal transduction histidine kinase